VLVRFDFICLEQKVNHEKLSRLQVHFFCNIGISAIVACMVFMGVVDCIFFVFIFYSHLYWLTMKLLIALAFFATTSNAQTLGLKSCVESCFTKYDKQNACVAKKPLKAKKVKKRKVKPAIVEPLCTIAPVETIFVEKLPDITAPAKLGGTLDRFFVHPSQMTNFASNYVNAGYALASFNSGFNGITNGNYLMQAAPVMCLNSRAGHCKNDPLVNVKEPMETPLPASAWLFISGLAVIFKRKFK
jgi:hypothetical protein